MPTRAETLARASQLRAKFEAAGADVIETPVLQPADTLLDLYGEDIRARAYVTSDALRGEQMLRPDFTVPVVQKHMEHGAEPARYTYAGEVFRRQEDDPDRPNEYVQVGYEVFDRLNPAAADSEVFSLIAKVLAPLGLQTINGDIGLLMAAVRGLRTSAPRKMALIRHIWRPRRFRALLDRFSGQKPEPKERTALLSKDDPLADAGPLVGVRNWSDIESRIEALRTDATTPPISQAEVDLIDALLAVRETAPFALEQLRDIAVDMPSIRSAVNLMQERLAALDARGVDIETLAFDASYGRTLMEYYDGFVFGFYAESRPDLPAIATGGRYDALTRQLGQGAEIPAVGGVMRPGLILELEGSA